MQSDLSYYRKRASQERTAALQTRNLSVVRVHLELARLYEDRVRAMAAQHEQLYVPLEEVS